jgi:hypothetical protein
MSLTSLFYHPLLPRDIRKYVDAANVTKESIKTAAASYVLSSSSSSSEHRVLSTLSVAALCYFNVSGGPVGSSLIINSGGPFVGLIALAIFPFLYCIPIALVTAELSTAYPNNGNTITCTYPT